MLIIESLNPITQQTSSEFHTIVLDLLRKDYIYESVQTDRTQSAAEKQYIHYQKLKSRKWMM